MNERDQKTPSSTSSRGLRVSTGLQAGATGTVNWYHPEKGFGFIIQDAGGPDIFAYKGDLVSLDRLVPNMRVSYDVAPGPKGPQAKNIRPDV